MAAPVFSDVKRHKPVNGIRRGIINMTIGSDNYTTGGFSVTATNLGLEGIRSLRGPTVKSDGSANCLIEIYRSSDTQWYVRTWTALGTEHSQDGAWENEILRLEYEGY